MKNMFGMMVLWGACGLGSGAVNAEDNGFYAGASLGVLDLDLSNGSFRDRNGAAVDGDALDLDFDTAPLATFMAGYNWGGWAVELEIEGTLGDADMELGSTSTRGDYNYRNYRVSGAYRSSGTLYFLGKLGYNIADLETQISGARFSMGGSVFYGLGGGYRFTPATALELGLGRSTDDTRSVTLGLRHHF